MVSSGDVGFFTAILFKIGLLIFSLLLGLQLISSMLPFPFDIMTLFSFEQFVFVFAVLIVTLLAFIEGFTLMKREKGFTFAVFIMYIISAFTWVIIYL